jgi:hypothetical protein
MCLLVLTRLASHTLATFCIASYSLAVQDIHLCDKLISRLRGSVWWWQRVSPNICQRSSFFFKCTVIKSWKLTSIFLRITQWLQLSILSINLDMEDRASFPHKHGVSFAGVTVDMLRCSGGVKGLEWGIMTALLQTCVLTGREEWTLSFWPLLTPWLWVLVIFPDRSSAIPIGTQWALPSPREGSGKRWDFWSFLALAVGSHYHLQLSCTRRPQTASCFTDCFLTFLFLWAKSYCQGRMGIQKAGSDCPLVTQPTLGLHHHSNFPSRCFSWGPWHQFLHDLTVPSPLSLPAPLVFPPSLFCSILLLPVHTSPQEIMPCDEN